MAPTPSLLIIDDEPLISAAVRPAFRSIGVDVRSSTTAAEGLNAVTAERPDAILVDVGLPDMSGLELFNRIRAIDGRTPIIVITGQGTMSTAIKAMKLGAYDYVSKPFAFSQIRDLVLRAFEISRAMKVPVSLSRESPTELGDADLLIGNSQAMQDVYKMIGRVAPQEGIVLIRGESGTGKELVARAIYQHSRRADGPFLAINCAAIPETLLEGELFGHEKGAFTGADRRRVGRFEQCNGGTLFLDEIGDMPLLTQAKILRVLQEQQFERVGGTETIHTDVRLIAATNRPLESMVAGNRFREDLFYRLNVFTISLPPLRHRLDDLPLLVQYFLRRFSREMDRDVREVAPEALELLRQYSWPGNLRELQSVLRQSLLQSFGAVLLPEFLPASVRPTVERALEREANRPSSASDWDAFLDERLKSGTGNLYTEWFSRTERQLLTKVLRYTNGNQLRAADILGITRRSLRNKIRTLGITIERTVSAEDNPDEDDPHHDVGSEDSQFPDDA